MKNSLRKIAAWLWATKERMMFAIMVIVLCGYVYQVVWPTELTEAKIFRPPGSELPAGVETPGVPPRAPGPPDSKNWTSLWRKNLFTYVSPGDPRRKILVGDKEIDLKLLNIQPTPNGSYRVQIRSASRKGWYSEGDSFESYEIISIDPDTEKVVVFAEEIGKAVEISKGD